MDFKDVAEQAYKNGYEDGKKEAVRDIIVDLLRYAGSNQEFTIVNDNHRTLIDCDKLFDKLGEIAKFFGIDLGEDPKDTPEDSVGEWYE